jgi:hypothetical protein
VELSRADPLDPMIISLLPHIRDDTTVYTGSSAQPIIDGYEFLGRLRPLDSRKRSRVPVPYKIRGTSEKVWTVW